MEFIKPQIYCTHKNHILVKYFGLLCSALVPQRNLYQKVTEIWTYLWFHENEMKVNQKLYKVFERMALFFESKITLVKKNIGDIDYQKAVQKTG